MENNEEHRRIIEEGDFGAWRVWLHREQRKYASRDHQGPFRLSGDAGTGKTVVLLHRTRHLAPENAQARIVLTAYTANHADALRRHLDRLDPDLPKAAGLGSPGGRGGPGRPQQLGVLDGGTYADLEDQSESTAHYHSSRHGPSPRIVPCSSLSAELDAAADLIPGWADDATQREQARRR